MSIKDHYESSFDAIAQKHGEKSSTPEIGPRDSLKKVIGYTRTYVVKHTTPHFRYKYYHDALSRALQRPRFDPSGRQVVHLDIGCGPGVFSWVMHDHMASKKRHRLSSVVYYGYDHCPAMIKLAHLFLKRFPARYDFRGYSDLDKMELALKEQDFSDCDVVVTFGYALVQVRESPDALGEFAELIRYMFPSHTCIVVAVDAYNDPEMRNAFKSQCSALEDALTEIGVSLKHPVSPSTRSIMLCSSQLGIEECPPKAS